MENNMPFYLMVILTFSLFFILMMTPLTVTSLVMKYHTKNRLAKKCLTLYTKNEHLITIKTARIIGTLGLAAGIVTMFGPEIQYLGNTATIIIISLSWVSMILLGATAMLVMTQAIELRKSHQGS
jgi:hypothetical protein